MPYLIEKSDGSRVPADLTPDEARFKAQQFRVIEVDADGAVVGDVHADGAEPVEQVNTALALDAAFGAIDEADVVEQTETQAAQEFHADQAAAPAPKPAPARKTATKAKK